MRHKGLFFIVVVDAVAAPYQLRGEFGGVVTSSAKAFIFKCEQTRIISAQCNNTCSTGLSACCDVFLLPESREGRNASCRYLTVNFIINDHWIITARQSSELKTTPSRFLTSSLCLCLQSTLYTVFALAANTRPPLGNRAVTRCHTELLRSSSLILYSTAGPGLGIRSHTLTNTHSLLFNSKKLPARKYSSSHTHAQDQALSQTLTHGVFLPCLLVPLWPPVNKWERSGFSIMAAVNPDGATRPDDWMNEWCWFEA